MLDESEEVKELADSVSFQEWTTYEQAESTSKPPPEVRTPGRTIQKRPLIMRHGRRCLTDGTSNLICDCTSIGYTDGKGGLVV